MPLGYRGADKNNVGLDIKHRGKFKSLTDDEKKSLKRRQCARGAVRCGL
jgi:IS5 family transposase